MADEIKTPETENSEFSLDDLAEFGTESEEAITIEEDEFVLAEDLEGFASGFPSWDLLPPKN